MADIFKGDIIKKINEDDVKDTADLVLKTDTNFGKKVTVTLVRDGNNLTKDVQLSQGQTVQDFKMERLLNFLDSIITKFKQNLKRRL